MNFPVESRKKSLVALVRCGSYESQEVYCAVKRGIDLLGGAQHYFKPREKIVLKPNVLAGNHPDFNVTTHPSIFEAVIRILQPVGVVLSYGDSPSLENREKAMKKSGLYDIAEKYGVTGADFENAQRVTHTTALVKGSFLVVKGILEADGVVNLPKLKTHGLTRMTGAVKNMFGSVPGLHKAKTHAQLPLAHDFSSFLVDINTYVRPRLHVMDAVVAMEGNGPQSGKGKKLGCILLSTDPVALDATACRIIALNPEYIPTCTTGQRAGLGTMDVSRIDIVGDALEEFVDASFDVVRHPPMFGGDKGIFRKARNKLMPRPVINASLCIACGKCVMICPVEPKALSWKNNATDKQLPVYNYTRCIRCFCCQETCPQKAISIKTHFLHCILPGLVILIMGSQFITTIPKKIGKKIKKRFFK